MNQLSLATAKFALEHADAIAATTAKLKAERERMLAQLQQMNNLLIQLLLPALRHAAPV